MGSPPGPICGLSGAAAGAAEVGAGGADAWACSAFSSAGGSCGMRVAAAAWAYPGGPAIGAEYDAGEGAPTGGALIGCGYAAAAAAGTAIGRAW
jgi:hypothetical protein